LETATGHRFTTVSFVEYVSLAIENTVLNAYPGAPGLVWQLHCFITHLFDKIWGLRRYARFQKKVPYEKQIPIKFRNPNVGAGGGILDQLGGADHRGRFGTIGAAQCAHGNGTG
jgi:hypothetical protein